MQTRPEAGHRQVRDKGFYPGEDLDAARADLERMPSGPLADAAHLRGPQRPQVDRLTGQIFKLDNAVSQGEHNVARQFVGRVLADQQQHRVGVGDPAGQVVQRDAQLAVVSKIAQHLGAVDHHDRRLLVQRLPHHLRYQRLQPVLAPGPEQAAQVDIFNGLVKGPAIEEGEGLQVPDELGMRLGHGRVVHALVRGGRPGEADLLSEDGLARAGSPGQDHDRSLFQAAVEHQIQPRDTSRQQFQRVTSFFQEQIGPDGEVLQRG